MRQHLRYIGVLAVALSNNCTADLADGNPCHAVVRAVCEWAARCNHPNASICYAQYSNFESECDARIPDARQCASDLENYSCEHTVSASCVAALSDYHPTYVGTYGGSDSWEQTYPIGGWDDSSSSSTTRTAGGASTRTASGGTHSIGGSTTKPASGGTRTTGGSSSKPASDGETNGMCAGEIPTASGSLTVSSGYVTSGQLHGFGFAYRGTSSNSTTCIYPDCTEAGCTPAFRDGSAICATGIVTKDSSYNSVAGLGVYVNQRQADSAISYLTIPKSITIGTYTGNSAANAYLRVSVIDTSGNDYCVDAGDWESGTPIPITLFNTACWNGSGESASASTRVKEVAVYVFSSATADRSFNYCVTDIRIDTAAML